MIRQVESGCEVRLNTEATPSLIQAGGYDALILGHGFGDPKLCRSARILPDVYLLTPSCGNRAGEAGGGRRRRLWRKEAALYLARQVTTSRC